MAQNGVSLVLNGHDHDYQRWQPLDGDGQPSPTGITEFVAGASGHGLQNIKNSDPRVAYSIDTNPTAFGALLLQLNPDGVSFSFHNTQGSVLDAGVVPCLKNGSDTQAPATPAGLAVTASSASKVDLTWMASSDNTGVSGYSIYRDGNLLANVPAASLSYTDASAQPATSYTYSVAAFDPAGNHSPAGTTVQVSTPQVSSNLVFPAVADAYVNADSPGNNYGGAAILRTDAAPDVHSYLRFDVEGLGGRSIARAQLKIFANSGSSKGISILSVTDNSWDESLLNFNNAPALGSALAVSDRITAGDWITLDVSAFVNGEGSFSFGITTAGPTAISLASRESGANAPQLLIDLR
jgi:hypothetical protein